MGQHDRWEPIDFVDEALEAEPEPGEIRRRIRKAVKARDRAQRNLEDATRDLAVWVQVGQQQKAFTIKDMATIAGLARETLHRMLKDHGLGGRR